MLFLDGAVAAAALGLAAWLRPWRLLDREGPPTLWLLAWLALPLFWGMDRFAAVPIAQPLSGASLLVLMAGWPLAMLAMLPVAAATAWAAHLGWIEGLHRLVWLGVVPGTLVLCIGAALRRWLPHHLFVYILGRGFFGTMLASTLASWAALALQSAPVGTGEDDLAIARLLAASGEAFLTGMLTAIMVAFRPAWLSTYSDRLYLPPHPPGWRR